MWLWVVVNVHILFSLAPAPINVRPPDVELFQYSWISKPVHAECTARHLDDQLCSHPG